MGLKGIAIGGGLGWFLLGGPLGAIFGAFFGHQLEKRLAWRRTVRWRTSGSATGPAVWRGSLQEAYAVLGASASDSPDELKKKYRELAKKNHPDALRAQGLPDELVGKATERMGRINAAWATIRSARSL